MVGSVCVKGFMDIEEEKHFLGVYLESGKQYEIYWFVWDRDGLIPIQDWEPVLLVYREDRAPVYCAIRPHYRWDVAPFDDLDLSHDGCVIVLFTGSHHGPVLKTKSKILYFDFELRNAIEINRTPIRVSKDEVPERARDPMPPFRYLWLNSVDDQIEELIQSL